MSNRKSSVFYGILIAFAFTAMGMVLASKFGLTPTSNAGPIRNADKIAVIHQGKVAELGTHDELMKEGGLYYSLAARQSA